MNTEHLLCKLSEISGKMREGTVRFASKRFVENNGKNIVETGCYSGLAESGKSTFVFAELARHVNGHFTSIDVLSGSIEPSRRLLFEYDRDLLKYVTFIIGDSVNVLSSYQNQVDLIYLDSLDFDYTNPLPSQLHQLAELGAVIGKLDKRSTILMDDYARPDLGKCKLSVEFLRNRKAKELMSGYQTCWSL